MKKASPQRVMDYIVSIKPDICKWLIKPQCEFYANWCEKECESEQELFDHLRSILIYGNSD